VGIKDASNPKIAEFMKNLSELAVEKRMQMLPAFKEVGTEQMPAQVSKMYTEMLGLVRKVLPHARMDRINELDTALTLIAQKALTGVMHGDYDWWMQYFGEIDENPDLERNLGLIADKLSRIAQFGEQKSTQALDAF
jgi:hypothetical protein